MSHKSQFSHQRCDFCDHHSEEGLWLNVFHACYQYVWSKMTKYERVYGSNRFVEWLLKMGESKAST